jgi:hypothetical protein
MFDIFYIGPKPNLFAHERSVATVEEAQLLSRTRYCWVINYLLDYTDFDFLWEPVPWESDQRHAWPSQHQKDAGLYLVPKTWNGVDTNYHVGPIIQRLPDLANWTGPEFTNFDYSWHPDYSEPPLVYQFGTQWQKTGGPVYTVPGATDIKFVNKPRVEKQTVDPNWKLPAGVEFAEFDYTWHPDSTDPPYIYQFGTQHQRTGGPQYIVEGAVDTKFVDQLRVRTSRVATAIIEIDHLDGNAGQISDVAKRVRYFDNYRDTLIRIAKSLQGQHEFVWICSSICDYEGFDFSWHPEQWQATMLHVFSSDEQKFGDTFFMHVPTFAERAEKKALLEWYDVNYIEKSVPRRRLPVIEHTQDSQADAVKNTEWAGPLALFTTNGLPMTIPTVPLWRTETKTIMPLSAGASAVIVPKVAKGDIRTQLYDYPYIDKTQRKRHSDQPLDIVFISNGEPNAEDNWMMLENRILGLEPNKLHRVDRVNGRAAAYHAAARASTTPWFFAVFGKLAIDLRFDWEWQPDRMQQAKHYIFHARNPVNGLEYGHQAMIAYNQELVLNNTGVGLDFTLDSPHEVVPILTGTAYYNSSAWQCWRTAFREVLKLKAALPDVEAEYRISRWLLPNFGDIDHWSQLGARDAVEYYDEVDGDFDALKKSYEWDWLATYAFIKRSLVTDL